MSAIRKRVWTNSSGKTRTAWLVDFKDKLGRRRAKQFGTQSEARNWSDGTNLQAVSGTSALTVKDAAQAWLARANSEGLERSTLEEYGRVNSNIAPYIGDVPLKALTKGQVIAFRTELSKKKSEATARRAIHHLKMILNYALDEEWVGRNVARRLRSSKSARLIKAERLNIQIPTPAEQRKILDACDRHTGGGQPKMRKRSRAFYALLMETGIRPSEARGLTWSNLDLRNRSIQIAQRANRWNELGPCKTAAAYRQIDISPWLVSIFEDWRPHCPSSSENLVFPTATGKPISHRNICREFGKLQRAAGISKPGSPGRAKFRPYDLRHGAASRWIHAHLDLKTLSSLLGHESTQVTLDVYGHVIANAKRRRAVRRAIGEELYGDATSLQHGERDRPRKSTKKRDSQG